MNRTTSWRLLAGSIATIALMVCVGLVTGSTATPDQAGAQAANMDSVPQTGKAQKAALLASAPDDVRGLAPGRAYATPTEMKDRAKVNLDETPFPEGRNSAAGYPWTGIPGSLSEAEIRDLVQYRASCDWFRHVLAEGSIDDEARVVLTSIPRWHVFRASPFSTQVVEPAINAALDGNLEPMRTHVNTGCVDLRSR